MNGSCEHPRCAGTTLSWEEHQIPPGTALTAILCWKICTVSCCSLNVAMAAAVVGKSYPRTPAVFGCIIQRLQDPSVLQARSKYAAPQAEAAWGSGDALLWTSWELWIPYVITASAAVTQDAAACTAALEQGIAAFTCGIALLPNRALDTKCLHQATRGHTENWRQTSWVPHLHSNPAG